MATDEKQATETDEAAPSASVTLPERSQAEAAAAPGAGSTSPAEEPPRPPEPGEVIAAPAPEQAGSGPAPLAAPVAAQAAADAPEPAAENDAGQPDPSAAPAQAEDDAPEISVQPAEGAEPAEGGAKKRRRRRRRRKPAEPGAEATAAAPGTEGAGPEGAPSDADDADDEEPPSGRERSGDRGGDRQRGDKRERERPAFGPGDQVFGKVARVTEQAIWIDIAGKAIGLFDRTQITGDPPKEGDQFIAKVQSCSARGGMVILVSEPAKGADVRALIRQSLEQNQPIEGWVTGVIKGGLEVDIQGVRAFAPASHVEMRPSSDLSHLLGQRLPFLISHYAKKGRDIVVSRKPMIEQQAELERGELLAKITPDAVCQGIVRRVLNWGAFVALPEFGDVEGVVHMSEASHDRGAKLFDIFKVGEQVTVKVLRVDDKGKLWLSRRAVEKNPWDDVAQRYRVGTRHHGTVVRLAEFGAFIQLEPGVDGLCHVSDLSFVPVEHPKDAVNIGDGIDVVVSNLDPSAHKISLHPAPLPEEQDEPRPKLQPNHMVQAVVVLAKEGGLAVRIVGLTGRAQRAFIPAGQTGTPRGTELRKVFPVGKRLEAKVIEVDPRKGEAKLSIKALKEDAERQAYRDYRKQVQREASFGTFADLLKKS